MRSATPPLRTIGQSRMRGFERVDQRIVERRYGAVIFRAQAFEQGLARMDDERRRACGLDRSGQRKQGFRRLLLVDADAAFDRDRDIDRSRHRRHAFADQRRLAHEARAEAAALYPVGRAAAVEIDLVVAKPGADRCGLGEPLGLRPAKLERDRMLGLIKADQPLARAEHDRVRRHHFGVEARAARKQPVERPAAPVGPVHHRRDGKAGAVRAHGGSYRRADDDCPHPRQAPPPAAPLNSARSVV